MAKVHTEDHQCGSATELVHETLQTKNLSSSSYPHARVCTSATCLAEVHELTVHQMISLPG